MQKDVHSPSGDPRSLPALSGWDRLKNFLYSIPGLTLFFLLALALYPGFESWLRLTFAGLAVVVVITEMVSSLAPFLCRCILPLLIGGICVEAYSVLQHWAGAADVTRYFVFKEDYSQNFYTGIATLYAIITALALVKGIEDFDAIKRNIADEAHKVRVISELTYYFDIMSDTSSREGILALRHDLLTYAQNVAGLRDQSVRDENLKVLRGCQRHISKLKPRDLNDSHSLQLMVEAQGELGVLRSKRIAAIGEKIPHYLIAALWLMALTLILPFMAEPVVTKAANTGALVDNPARFGQYYIIFVMGALNSFLLLMLSDISDPFQGFWTVSMQPFEELSSALIEQMAEDGWPASVAAA